MTTPSTDIQIPNIEKELNSLWNTPKTETWQQNKLSKACLFTLIIFVKEQRRVKYLQQLVDTILDRFPCRIIFIQGESESTESYCRATVSNVICGKTTLTAGSAVACDQIVINVSKDQFFRVPFIVTPHIVPDLPVYLLWGQNPFEEFEIFPHLQHYASRVIFDSECADSLSRFCDDMQETLTSLKIDLMDISWALISNWRDMMVQLFDTQEKIKELGEIKSVIILYNAGKTDTMQHPEIQALYFQAWLACCLKWEYRKIEKYMNDVVISYAGPLHPHIVALSPQDYPELPPGSIHSIEIRFIDNQTYVILAKPNISQVVVHVSSEQTCEMPFTLPLPNVHKGMTFLREIFFSKLGNHYSEMLKILKQINYKVFTTKP